MYICLLETHLEINKHIQDRNQQIILTTRYYTTSD